MKPYQINELERLTGIKAHTIRIWEKRYALIKPLRTATNRRYYSDNEVRKLLNVSTLLSAGHKISKIAAFTDQEISAHIQSGSEQKTITVNSTGHINDLVSCMLSFDEAQFEQIFSTLVGRYGFFETMLKVIYPFMNKVGVLWSVNESEVAQEHFATNIIRRKLMVATDALPAPGQKNAKFLLYLPEGEWHDTGLMFANYLLRATGYVTIYLGQNMSYASLVKAIPVVEPTHILVFYIAARPVEEIEDQLKVLAGSNKNVNILVAGRENLFPGKKSSQRNVTYLKGVSALLEYLEE